MPIWMTRFLCPSAFLRLERYDLLVAAVRLSSVMHLPPLYRQVLDATVAEARRQLGDAEYEALYQSIDRTPDELRTWMLVEIGALLEGGRH
jgi:hypothetical protein